MVPAQESPGHRYLRANPDCLRSPRLCRHQSPSLPGLWCFSHARSLWCLHSPGTVRRCLCFENLLAAMRQRHSLRCCDYDRFQMPLYFFPPCLSPLMIWLNRLMGLQVTEDQASFRSEELFGCDLYFTVHLVVTRDLSRLWLFCL